MKDIKETETVSMVTIGAGTEVTGITHTDRPMRNNGETHMIVIIL